MHSRKQPLAGERDAVVADAAAPAMRIAVGIVTRDRAAILAETLAELARQTRPPDEILIGPTSDADLPGEMATPVTPRIVMLPRGAIPGASAQRNLLLDATDADIVLFLDDDFLPAPGYLAAVEAAFAADPNLVAATGTVIADGIKGPGITVAAARDCLARDGAAGHARETDTKQAGTYGCNMAFRVAAVRAHGIRFDENLPFYSWQEDNDFSRRLGRHGGIMRLAGARGVHLGHKAGRTSGRRLGYSQVANFVYLARKGSIPGSYAASYILRNLLANLVGSVRPEPWVDRRGRLRGNMLALADLLRGRCDPRRIISM
jgi:GT2 family glycosyltransferase